MRLLNRHVAEDFARRHAGARRPLERWMAVVDHATWSSFRDVRATFSTVDRYGTCYVFNMGGNNFRLIAGIDYDARSGTIARVMTHAEYDRDRWKRMCE